MASGRVPNTSIIFFINVSDKYGYTLSCKDTIFYSNTQIMAKIPVATKKKFSIRFHERELIRNAEVRLKLILTNTLTDN